MTIHHDLKMLATSCKILFTDDANVEQLFCLIQSVHSPKEEPLKL